MPFVLRCSSPAVRNLALSIALAVSPALFLSPITVQAQSLDTPTRQTLIWNVKQQGAYVTSLLRDSRGRNWAATENNGVWMSDAQSPNGWRGYNKSNSGIGDNSFYALTEDQQGRIWAGTLNRGVSVFNGKTWKNFGVLDIPIGERVFDIAVSPLDGDVWIASSRGLTRYHVKTDSWQQLTRENGLPSDQAQALAFDSKGTLYVATQCDGLAIGSASNEYSKWRVVKGLTRLGTTPTGRGLPTNILNDVLVTKSGLVFVATLHGLAKSTDSGKSWSYVRGRDYEAKLRESWIGAPKTANGKPWQAVKSSVPLLAEDNVTSLSEDARGNLWLGHRWQVPYEVIDANSGEVLYTGSRDNWRGNAWQKANNFSQTDKGINDYVMAILPLPHGQALIARYGGGVTWTSWQDAKSGEKSKTAAISSTRTLLTSGSKQAASLKFPSVVAPPTVKELQSALASWKAASKAKAANTKTSAPAAVYLGEDWTTQGDWVGRYGTRYAMLFAMQAPLSHEVVSDARYRIYNGDIGPHRLLAQNINDLKGHALPKDALRYWISWHREHSNRNVLYNPVLGFRRQAEADDHSEATSQHTDMGSVWTKIVVPNGIHKVSGYWWNKDGESSHNRFRDYLLEIKADAPDVAVAEGLKPLAQSRIRDFKGGGVYKSFLVQGPGRYWLKVGRNYSFNTIVPAVFLDKVSGPKSQFDHIGSPYLAQRYTQAPAVDEKTLQAAITGTSAKAQTLKAAVKLWQAMDEDLEKSSTNLRQISTQSQWRLLSYRAASSKSAPNDLLANWRYALKLWTDADRKEFDSRMQQAHKTLLVANPEIKLLQQ